MSEDLDIQSYIDDIAPFLSSPCLIRRIQASSTNAGGGTSNTYVDDSTTTCRVFAVPTSSPLRMGGAKSVEITRFIVAIPVTSNLRPGDRIVTNAGNNGVDRIFEVENPGGRTDGLTRQAVVRQIT